jgi:DNA-binding NtrC family response regulator
MVDHFLREAAEIAEPNGKNESYFINEDASRLLRELDYPGNVRALRNLIFELTSYVTKDEPISMQLVQSILDKLHPRRGNHVARISERQSPSLDDCDNVSSGGTPRKLDEIALQSFLFSIARAGDIILPIELCVLRSDETFKQWTARAKRCTIEATRNTTGGSMRCVAQRLGLTRNSLFGHLRRAKQVQSGSLFD